MAGTEDGFQPLRLTWRVQNWMEPSLPLHLDGLVCHAMISEGLAHGTIDRSASIRSLVDRLDLPLARATRGSEFAWMASALRAVDVHVTGMRIWTRKINADAVAEAVRGGVVRLGSRLYDTRHPPRLKPFAYKVDTSRGIMKGSFKYVPVQVPESVVAHCVGDETRLRELLHPDSGHVTYLGRGRQGLGRVLDFRIDRDEEAVERWKERVLPWAEAGCVEMRLAARPPYWDVSNVQRAWVNPDIFG